MNSDYTIRLMMLRFQLMAPEIPLVYGIPQGLILTPAQFVEEMILMAMNLFSYMQHFVMANKYIVLFYS